MQVIFKDLCIKVAGKLWEGQVKNAIGPLIMPAPVLIFFILYSQIGGRYGNQWEERITKANKHGDGIIRGAILAFFLLAATQLTSFHVYRVSS